MNQCGVFTIAKHQVTVFVKLLISHSFFGKIAISLGGCPLQVPFSPRLALGLSLLVFFCLFLIPERLSAVFDKSIFNQKALRKTYKLSTPLNKSFPYSVHS